MRICRVKFSGDVRTHAAEESIGEVQVFGEIEGEVAVADVKVAKEIVVEVAKAETVGLELSDIEVGVRQALGVGRETRRPQHQGYARVLRDASKHGGSPLRVEKA